MDRGAIEPRSGVRFPDESFATVADPSLETHPHGSRRGLLSAAPPGLTQKRLEALLAGLLARQPKGRPADALVVHELIALEIAALGHRRAG